MGSAARERPERLAEKLLQIRTALDLSQSDMLRRLGVDQEGYRHYVSQFETGKREPPLRLLVRYAEEAGVWVDVLIKDELNLPEKIPCSPKHEGVLRKSSRNSR